MTRRPYEAPKMAAYYADHAQPEAKLATRLTDAEIGFLKQQTKLLGVKMCLMLYGNAVLPKVTPPAAPPSGRMDAL